MPLVSYEESSDSEEEGKIEVEERNIPNFATIPKPVPNKERETVKITIPSLDQFKDEEIKVESKAKPIFKGGSGLLSMLPPPKYSGTTPTQRGFTPHVLTKQKTEKKVPSIKSAPIKPSSNESIKQSISKGEHPSESITATNDDEDDDSSSFDFFSLESTNKKSEDNCALDPMPSSESLLFSSLPEPVQTTTHTVKPNYQEPTSSSSTSELFASSSFAQSENSLEDSTWKENDQGLYSSYQTGAMENYQSVQNVNQTDAETPFFKDEEFKKLMGRKKEDIQFIDVNADDQLVGKEQWLMQSLTEEKGYRPSKRKGDMPTQQQKRKHQITYLAFQAKEREFDLKNQWSSNRRTKRETQAKYGF